MSSQKTEGKPMNEVLRKFKFLEIEDGDWNLQQVSTALYFVAVYNGDSHFCDVMCNQKEFIKLMEFFLRVLNTYDVLNSEKEGVDVRARCFNTITNLLRIPVTSTRMLNYPKFLDIVSPYWFDEGNDEVVQSALNILRNLTHASGDAMKVVQLNPEFVTKAVLKISELKNIENQTYENYAAFLCNATQTVEGRRIIMDQKTSLLPRVFVFLDHDKFSIVCRKAIAGLLKNCCMDAENHDWLLSPDIDILSPLLLPLTGPEEFEDDEYKKMPIDLQYLPSDKTREPDGEVRHTLLEALMTLCLTRKSREIIRDNNVYCILREYHLWEPNADIQSYLEELVNIIIRTEEEIGVDDFRTV